MILGRLTELLRRLDWVLLGVTLLLVAVGLAALFSITLNVEQPRIDKFYRQLLSFGLGVVLLVSAISFDYRMLRSGGWLFYTIGLFLLTAVLIIGATFRGTTGWFAFLGQTFQPVEIVKIILVIVLARYFAQHIDQGATWRVIGVSAAISAVPAVLILIQPDLGSALLLLATWFGMLMFLRLSWRRLAALVLGVIIIALIGWLTLQDYQRDRILTFLDPGRDPLRSGYNIRQAIVAVGSGQFFGRGLGLGTQSQLNFLPTQDTDFIFAVVAEELGLVGVVLLLSLFGIFLSRFVRGLRSTRDVFGAFLLAGLFILFAVEIILNISGNIGLLPITGTPLPFLSFGGSALISSMIGVGLALGIMSRSAI